MTKLFVGGLLDDGLITAEDLRPLFEEVGVVQECDRIKNYAFVRMANEESAQEAIAKLNGRMVKGRPIKVEKSESKGPRKPSHKLFIGNIGVGTTAAELKALVEKYIPVLEADVLKNYGFVHIDVESSRQKIDEVVDSLNGESLGGCAIRAEISTSRVRHKPGMGGDLCYKCGKGGHWSKECSSVRSFRPDSRRNDNFGGPGPMRRDRGNYSDRSNPYRADDKFTRNRPQRSRDFDEFERSTNRSGHYDTEYSSPRTMSFPGRSVRNVSGRQIQEFGHGIFQNGGDPFDNSWNKMSTSDSRYGFDGARQYDDGYQTKPGYPESYQSSNSYDSHGYSGSSGNSGNYPPRQPGYTTSSDPYRQTNAMYDQDLYSTRPGTRGAGYDSAGQSSFSAG